LIHPVNIVFEVLTNWVKTFSKAVNFLASLTLIRGWCQDWVRRDQPKLYIHPKKPQPILKVKNTLY